MIVAVFPGRFQPFHQGHAMVYEYLTHEYGRHAYIATSNITNARSPFSFEEKQQLAECAGVPVDHVIETAQPYRPEEILQNYNADRDGVIFALSDKDADRFEVTDSSYFQWLPESGQPEHSFALHGYLLLVPTLQFEIQGVQAQSATTIRNLYRIANNTQRTRIIQDLYGEFCPVAKQIFDRHLA